MENQNQNSIDLSNQKLGESQFGEQEMQHLLGKTEDGHEFLAVSNQTSAIQMQPQGQLVSSILDSQASSPTMRSDIALRNTAQFPAARANASPQQDQSQPQRQRATPHQILQQQHQLQQQQQQQQQQHQQQQQVLAASGPGQPMSHHLKSQSTSNTNYWSNMQASGLIQVEHQNQLNNSQGRSTETRKKNQQTSHVNQPIQGLTNQGQTAKSAVLYTANKSREIKKIPSKTKVSENKSEKRRTGMKDMQPMLLQDNVLNMPNEAIGINHVTSNSLGRPQKQNQPVRNNSQSNRMMQQNIEGIQNPPGVQHHPISQQHTPNLTHQNQIPAGVGMFNPGGQPMPNVDLNQGFSFMTPAGQNPFQQFTAAALQNGLMQQQQQILASSQMGFQMQPQPQVHFIAKQQKFYNVSPERAPLIFKHNSQDKRPYTSSGHVLGKRVSKPNAQSSAIAALYNGSKTHQNGFGVSHMQNQRNQSHPGVDELGHIQQASNAQIAYSMANIPARTPFGNKKNNAFNQSNSTAIYRKDKNQGSGHHLNHSPYAAGHSGTNYKVPEQMQEQILQLKQSGNVHKEENVKLKTKIKILENEMGRKERAMEDFLQQNQFIQNAQKNASANGNLNPIVQTAQRYQAETFLVMSLKKQVKELKAEISKEKEEHAELKKNVKNTKIYELDLELKVYKDELIRMRNLLEQNYQGDTWQDSSGKPNIQAFTTPFFKGPNFLMPGHVQSQNQSQPSIMPTAASAGATFQIASNSQQNLFQDQTSNMSQHQPGGPFSQMVPSHGNQYTLSNDDQDQASNYTNETNPSQLPPLKNSNGQSTPIQKMQTNPMNFQQEQNSYTLGPDNSAEKRSNEFMQILAAQIAEKDVQIRKLQKQVEEYSRQRPMRSQNANSSEGKGGSAGPTSKTELARTKKQLREREREIQKLKNENAQANIKNNSEEEQEKKVKQLQGQVNQFLKKSQEMKNELKKKDEKNELLAKELSEQQKQSNEKSKREQIQTQKKLQTQIEELTQKLLEKSKENEKMKELPEKIQEENQEKDAVAEKVLEKEEVKDEKTSSRQDTQKSIIDKYKTGREDMVQIDPKSEGELGLVSTVLGCRENRDRIEFASDLKEFIAKKDLNEEEIKSATITHLGLASDYKLVLSAPLIQFIKNASSSQLAKSMPKYDFINPSLALIIMQEIRKLLVDPELIEILNEKDSEIRLPFDALRDLCSRFDRNFTDEHCAFITASYLSEIQEGVIFVNFKEFLVDLKDTRAGREYDMTGSKLRGTSSLGSDDSSGDLRRMLRAAGGGSPLSDIMNRSSGKGGSVSRGKRTIDEEHMLDIAEAIFMKMADLMNEKGKSVRGIFTKFSVPELFPDRTVLELISPPGFIEGLKETGIGELQEFELACLMRVLSKPELESSIILNEFIMIMENFGVMDQPEEDENDDFISDTEMSIIQSVDNLDLDDVISDTQKEDGDEKKVKVEAEKNKDEKTAQLDASKDTKNDDKKEKEKRKPRQHCLKNIDAKGIKVMRKLARFLLKNFLHPREFFGKAITKEPIKTKRREFHLDVLKFKDFYLRIKIANIRKRLTQNQSLNHELCLDKKSHKELINVKLMVKALEELAEEEQQAIVIEEREAAEKLLKEEEIKKEAAANQVDTPRSDDECKVKARDIDATSNEEKKEGIKQESQDKEALTKEEQAALKESENINMMKFGNASVRTQKSNVTHSPLIGQREFYNLNTIEEEKNETQTSNYVENASEREDSRLLSSNNLRNSNMAGLDFEDDSHKISMPKLSPEVFDQTLSRDDKPQSASQVVSHNNDIDKADTNIEHPEAKRVNNEGRMATRTSSVQEQQMSKSLAETSISQMQQMTDKDYEPHKIAPFTPQIVQNKVQDGLPTPQSSAHHTHNHCNSEVAPEYSDFCDEDQK